MESNLILAVIMTGVSIGLSCGVGCSPVINVFLSTHIISHANGTKKALVSFFSFFLGKLLSVTLLCIIASLIGKQFITENGYIGVVNLRIITQLVMSAVGLVLVAKWFLEHKNNHTCKSCKGCNTKKSKSGFFPMLIVGITYGVTPCGPLIAILAYSITLPPALAGITGSIVCLI